MRPVAPRCALRTALPHAEASRLPSGAPTYSTLTYPTLARPRRAETRRWRSGAAPASARPCRTAATGTAAAGPRGQSPQPHRAALAAPQPRTDRRRRLETLATRGRCRHAGPRLRCGLLRLLPYAALRLSVHRRQRPWGTGLREGTRRRRGAAARAHGRHRRAVTPRARACRRRTPAGWRGAGRSIAAAAFECGAPLPGCMGRHQACCTRCSAPTHSHRLRAQPCQTACGSHAPARAPHHTPHAQQGRWVAPMHACLRLHLAWQTTSDAWRKAPRPPRSSAYGQATPTRPCPPNTGRRGVLLRTRGQASRRPQAARAAAHRVRAAGAPLHTAPDDEPEVSPESGQAAGTPHVSQGWPQMPASGSPTRTYLRRAPQLAVKPSIGVTRDPDTPARLRGVRGARPAARLWRLQGPAARHAASITMRGVQKPMRS